MEGRADSENIGVELKEAIRFRKKMYNLESVWRGYVEVTDIRHTPSIGETSTQHQEIEHVVKNAPMMFGGGGNWKGGQYVSGLIWKGGAEEHHRGEEGKREGELRRGEGGAEQRRRTSNR